MKYFTVEELSRSATAEKYGIDNRPDGQARERLDALVAHVLDPLREAYGKPIRVTSGYRSPAVNSHPEVGGAKKSHHMQGCAADVTGGTVFENRKIFELAIELDLPFCQLIWEKGNNIGPQWVHVSFVAGDVRKQVRRTINGRNYFNCDKEGKAV